MPAVVAEKSGRCTACRGLITRGEYAAYDRKRGMRHPECSREQVESRPNEKPGVCLRCRSPVPTGAGVLVYREEERDGRWAKQWLVKCASCA